MTHRHLAEGVHEAAGIAPPPTHLRAAFSLLRVAALLSDEMDQELQKATGLGLSEILVIIQVLFAETPMKMADLADTLVVTRGGVTKIVDRLVEAGYIARVPSSEDRRVIHAEATEKARKLIAENQPMVEQITGSRIGGLLGPDEVERLHDMLHVLSCENPGWAPPFDGGAAEG